MKRFFLTLSLIAFLGFLFISLRPARAQNRANGQNPPPAAATSAQLSPDEVIKRFTEKESDLREVWKDYAYRQETKLQVLGPAKTVSGEYYQVSDFVFDDKGRRIEKIVRAPQSTLRDAGLEMTADDKNAMVNLQPFALAKEELPNYKLSYVGKEKLDELNTYVFDVTPKAMIDQRELKRLRDQKIEGKYFQGRIWVDDQDLQIVKTDGKTVPEFKQRFPRFQTYRENIDGRYWFPTYTYGEDDLDFDKGLSIRVRLVIRYKDYRQFQSDVKIVGASEEVKDESVKEDPAKKPDPAKKDEPPNKTGKADDKSPAQKPTPTPTPRIRKLP
jgi:hypothetical protein